MDFSTFWQTYPQDLCTRKGSKKVAEQKWLKLDEETQNQVMINIRELMRVDRRVKKSGEFVPRWPMVSTWIHQARWEDIEHIKQSEDMPELHGPMCECGEPTEIVNLCWNCHDKKFPPDLSLQKATLKRLGLWRKDGESQKEWGKRCKTYCTEKTYMENLSPNEQQEMRLLNETFNTRIISGTVGSSGKDISGRKQGKEKKTQEGST